MRRVLALALAAGALAGCSLEPHYVRPQPLVPQTWPTGIAYRTDEGQPLPSLTYAQVFQDPKLQGLIAAALANNQNLEQSLANIDIAQAQYQVQRADLFPHVNANATASVGQTRLGTALNTPGGGTSTPSGGGRVTTRNYGLNIGFTSWQLDLFGRVRSLSHAALDQYLASEAGSSAARLTLVGEVAQAYYTLAADRSLLDITQQTLGSATQTLNLTRARLTGGVAPRTDLTQAQTLVQQTLSDLAQLQTQVAQDRNALDLLVGRPTTDAELPASIESVDGQIGETPAGLDSRILLRRPDVVEAEFRLKAANAQIGAARAAFFPTISLTTLVGFASPQLSQLFNGNNFTWTAAGAASQSIFSGGANTGNLKLAEGERRLALAQYQAAIQGAFRDVANALARRGTMEQQLAAETAAEAAAGDAFNLETARYREGIDPYLNTLVTQRTLYQQRQALASARLVRAVNLVSLYTSLGGDQLIDGLPPPPPPKAVGTK
jgi:multidrug efflux system outer membrane protein